MQCTMYVDSCVCMCAQVTDLLREGAPIGSGGEGQADNFFHAHRYVLKAAAQCVPGCSLVSIRMQTYVKEAAILCEGGCSPT